MTKVLRDEDVRTAGDWFIRYLRRDEGDLYGLSFRCCGCGSECYIPIGRELEPNENKWEWNGSLDAPTLKPSIRNRCCGWHGHLTDGLWTAKAGSIIPVGANP